MQAEIIATGNEIVSGQILDTNTQWLSQRLEELGVEVLYHVGVGDDLEALVGVFRQAMGRSDVVISTGGLGPTPADLTREAVARAAGRKLLVDPEALKHVCEIFARRKREMPKRNEVQALMPEGSRMVHNPDGTAPGIALEVPRGGGNLCRFYALPGVPAEMRQMWRESLAGLLRQAGAGQRLILHRNINCFGAGESQIESMLPGMIGPGRKPHIGINASQTTIILRITAEGASPEACRAAMEPTVATIRKNLGSLVYGEEDEGLQHAVARLLRRQNKSLATVEWGTGGLLADWLGDLDAAQGFYLGGLAVTGHPALHRVLDVPADLLARQETAGGEIVELMAVRCRERFGADLGLAVGRFPKIDGHAAEPKPVFIALAASGGAKRRSVPLAGHPATLRVMMAKHALNMVRLELLEGE
jgi:nicotinamide-nucleotide amidase